MHRLLLLAALLLVTVCCRAEAQGVERLWATNCANCHGRDGQGGGAGTRTLLTVEQMAPEHDRPYFDAIKIGVEVGGMPGFGETMTDPQMWALVNYIRELQHRAYRRDGGEPEVRGGVYQSKHHRYRLETVVARGLDTPWSIDFLPAGDMLITERPGPLRVFKDGKLSPPVSGTPEVLHSGQGGMMEVAAHPEYEKTGWIFLAFSDRAAQQRNRGMTKLVRGKLRPKGDGWEWTDQQTVFEARQEHYINSGVHYGCKIAFDPKNPDVMFFGIGERGHQRLAQDLSRPNGKVYRVGIDGSIPGDNPFVGETGAYGAIWSYGHRNPQGLAFDLQGHLWDTEHAPRGGDELNLVRKGANYGWPIVSFGIEYSGAPLSVPWPELAPAARGKDLVMPTYRWLPSCAASGLDVVRAGAQGEAFPAWRGDMLAGGLAGQNIDRLRLRVNPDGSSAVVEREELLFGKGRVRDIDCGPDGSIYIALNDPHTIVRLVPVSP